MVADKVFDFDGVVEFLESAKQYDLNAITTDKVG